MASPVIVDTTLQSTSDKADNSCGSMLEQLQLQHAERGTYDSSREDEHQLLVAAVTWHIGYRKALTFRLETTKRVRSATSAG